MKRKWNFFIVVSVVLLTVLVNVHEKTWAQRAPDTGVAESARWSEERANIWYMQYGWLRGCNFIPHTAINQLEMWQGETFDTVSIGADLRLAASIGLNCMRVFLHHAAWQQDAEGFKRRMDKYLEIAHRDGIVTIFVFFDDCWNDRYHLGTQPAPKPGVHNSGWLRDPGAIWYEEPRLSDTLEAYVKDVMSSFRHDRRILLWDLYNEPGNSHYGDSSLDLLQKVFHWARQVNPDQPLSSGLWSVSLGDLNLFQSSHSDVITYHNYDAPSAHDAALDILEKFGRPLLCTEYMARRNNSLFTNIMPLLKSRHVAAINWGLVSGKTNTIYAWDTPVSDGSEPVLWFHDIFRKDGTPFRQSEIDAIRELTGQR